MNEMKRYDAFDVLKCLCAFCIVFIHTGIQTTAGSYLSSSVCRYAVPCFFMISGFFHKSAVERKREGRQIRKILVLLLVSTLVYFVYGIVNASISGNLSGYFDDIFSWIVLFHLLVFNYNPIAGQLWYLQAILYVLVIMWIFRRIGKEKILYFFIPFLLLGNIFCGYPYMLVFGSPLNDYWVKNFFFAGLPFFLIGDLIRRKEDKILLATEKVWAVVCMIALTLLLTFAAILERTFLQRSGQPSYWFDYYISTFFAAPLVFILFLRFNRSFGRCFLFRALAFTGRRYSMVIYVVHTLIINMIGSFIVLGGRRRYIELIAVCLLSLAVAALVDLSFVIVRKIKKKHEKAVSP